VIRASDLLGCTVQTESGDALGRVHDLRAHAADGEWRLMGLVVGPGGVRARLGAGADGDSVRTGRVIPWEAIASLEDGSITVRDEPPAAP
jgi:sporulation protein YlmC with PRC-barrel domain